MKLIKINESQKSRLFEAYQDGFSFETLSSLAFDSDDSPSAQYDYCVKWLGKPSGKGSSRTVFMLSDNLVLKLAYSDNYFDPKDILNNVGTAQNRAECEVFKKVNSPLLPRIFYHDENYTFIVCENVVPAEEEDFEKILGYPYHHRYFQNSQPTKLGSTFTDCQVGYNKYFDNIKKPYEPSDISVYDILEYIHEKSLDGGKYVDEELEDIISKSQWLQELVKLVRKSKMSDFCSIDNFGMVNRDGKPTLVILDSGLNVKVWRKYYGTY